MAAELPAVYNAVLADMRAHGMSLPTFVEWEELSAQDKALLANLVASMLNGMRDEFRARVRSIADLAERAYVEAEQAL